MNPYTVYLRCIYRPICPIPPCLIPCFIHFPPCWKLFTKKNACSTGSPRRRHKTRIMFLTISFFLLRKIFTGRYPLRTSALPSIAAVPMSAIPSSLPPAAISGNILTSFESKRQKTACKYFFFHYRDIHENRVFQFQLFFSGFSEDEWNLSKGIPEKYT